ncbi:hypothetical protein DFH07DRAFT_976903 [Mycena maculata]|uniref:Uncharacterized protein n=1 Tax=Mycena maculata TaxID=230809 RepID=A0AAD7K5V6_9AGAR|nr:hypothetical protein DFH07DRAFT_976903 [Mycena maculata]
MSRSPWHVFDSLKRTSFWRLIVAITHCNPSTAPHFLGVFGETFLPLTTTPCSSKPRSKLASLPSMHVTIHTEIEPPAHRCCPPLPLSGPLLMEVLPSCPLSDLDISSPVVITKDIITDSIENADIVFLNPDPDSCLPNLVPICPRISSSSPWMSWNLATLLIFEVIVASFFFLGVVSTVPTLRLEGSASRIEGAVQQSTMPFFPGAFCPSFEPETMLIPRINAGVCAAWTRSDTWYPNLCQTWGSCSPLTRRMPFTVMSEGSFTP